jgi:hypothetical protein
VSEPVQSHGLGYSRPPTRKGVFWGFMLLGSPSAFLAMLTARYALRDPSCGYGGARIALEVCGALSLIVSVVIAVLSWKRWRAAHLEWPNDGAEPAARDRFIAVLCFALALFGIAASIMLWAPTFVMSVCDTQ